MKTKILMLFGVAAMTTPVMPRGCATVNVGIQYEGQYGTYSATRRVDRNSGQPAAWDILISADGKRIMPLHP